MGESEPVGLQPAPADKVGALIGRIRAQEQSDLREARAMSGKIRWTARFVLVLAFLSFGLSILATGLKIPSYYVTIALALTGALEWLRQNRGWREKAAAFWASHDRCDELARELEYQNASVSHDRLAKLDRDLTEHLRKRGDRLSKAGEEADKKNLAGIFTSAKHDAQGK
jgi:hypothetical protein